ncbi:hypothetical protein Nmel_001421, partial [Mimus melanotis]
GVFHHGAIILLNTSFCQALSLRPDGSCSGAGQQQQESYWKVHKIGSGLCMFESVKKPRMYLKIKDDQCDGTPMGTSAAPKQEKKDFRESQFHPTKAQEPVPQRPSTPPPS